MCKKTIGVALMLLLLGGCATMQQTPMSSSAQKKHANQTNIDLSDVPRMKTGSFGGVGITGNVLKTPMPGESGTMN